ncbi:zinc finger protein BRUTUS-like At1g18910 [Papaver somniferum]|uniref:zinc finger protein BRUTUS-like At1g18910 n=1 Tax=Papaver somniferum TaxID=3469 RepID=UPI000E70023D|nr:zinc finger protein BRUTUS-like At1g18910 [Papaver somniferum]
MEYLIVLSGKMDLNLKFLKEFLQRFHLFRFLYKIHCDSEDEIVFPAVEAMAKLQNISFSCSNDHKLEKELLSNVTDILYEMCELHVSFPAETSNFLDGTPQQRLLYYRSMCTKLHDMCKTMRIALEKHVYHDEIQVWSSFLEFFLYEEQEKIIGRMLGRTRAENLQVILSWLMMSLSPGEQHGIWSILFKATKNTMFTEWLAEWWDGIDKSGMTATEEEFNGFPLRAEDPLEIVATYLSSETCNELEGMNLPGRVSIFRERGCNGVNARLSVKDNAKPLNRKLKFFQGRVFNGSSNEDEKRLQGVIFVKDQVEKPAKVPLEDETLRHDQKQLLNMSHEDSGLEIRRISHDITRSLASSQQKHHQEVARGSNNGEIPGHYPSYQNEAKGTFGCKHYKRNCKLFASCCNQFFTCMHCHNESVLDHTMDRESTTEMMCMKCMKVQPIGPACSNISCDEFSMAKYFCGICKLYDDDREIYHCPFCNICRVGKGLGIDYCHCMNCNTCLSTSFSTHICREKSFESNCPICQEYIFTSRSPVKALACGHLMHSECFKEYTCTQYTCPICNKSLGNMKVYFKMIDDLLAEEILPEEYSEMTQDILCHDCEKKGVASFHWLHHKCTHCASYNTRLL